MNVVIIAPDFQKGDFIAFLNFGTNFFQLGIHDCRKDSSPVL
jgi:hypothetical protein